MTDLWQRLKHRKLVQWAVAYVAAAFALLQGVDIVAQQFGWPETLQRGITLAMVLGFFVALVLAWYHGEKGEQSASTTELVILAVLLAIGGGLMWRYAQVSPDVEITKSSTAGNAVGTSAANTAIPEKSIAVLAFADLSPQHDQEYFSDGIAEEILNALAQVKDLKVAGRTSSFSFKGKNEDLRVIGETLGVAHVLEGSVRKQGDKVRITAQLIRSKDGFHLWSETYDGDLKDVFALQERIAQSITETLSVVLSGKQAEQLVNAGTSNPDAYALYLKATATFDKRDGAHMREAIEQLQQAVALDPGYARAYSRLATLQAILPTYIPSEVAKYREQVETTARRAIGIDPRLAEPWAAMGLAAPLSGSGMLEARQYFEKALQLDPDDITSNFWFGLTLVRSGYNQAGVERIEHALAVDPMVPNVMRWRGVLYLRDGNLDGAEQFLKRAQAAGLQLGGRELGEIEFRRGETELARRSWIGGSQPLLKQLPAGSGEVLANALFGGTDSDRAHGISVIDNFIASDPPFIPGMMPLLLAQLGSGAQALELERTRVKVDNVDFMVMLFSPAGKSLRQLPEFPGYLRAKGFPALWDKYGAPDMCSKNDAGEYVCK
ncbi:tetratricopeptide repeat protein [Thermomonas sp.]